MIDHQKMLNCLKIYQQKKLEEQGVANTEHQIELLGKDETVTTAISEISQIDAKNLPSVISQQFSKITDLEEKVKKAKKSAEDAKKQADDAKNKSTKLGHKKEAIEALQTATADIAKSEGDIIDAMNVSFEYQQQLGQVTQYLFMLGVSNIAATRTVIQQLRLELQKAPKEKMSDLAKNEIMAVIRQLEAQEDMAAKQEKHAEALKKHKKLIAEGIEKDKEQDVQISENAQDIDELERQYAEQDKLIAEGIEKDKTQDAQISENAQDINELERQDVEQDKLIAEGIQKNKAQDAQIYENAQDIDELERQDAEQDKLIAEGIQKDKTQDAQISENAQDIDELERQDAIQGELIAEGIEKDKEQDKLISEIQNTDQEQDEQIALNRDKNEAQDEAIRELIKENKKQAEEILILQEKIEQLQSELSTKGNKTLLIATSISSVAALIIAILQFFF